MAHSVQHDRGEALYSDYVAGTLSPAKHALVQEYFECNTDAANDIAFEEAVAGQLLAEASDTAMSEAFFDKVLDALPDNGAEFAETGRTAALSSRLNDIKWRTRLPGISTHDIVGTRKSSGDRLYLLKVKPGFGIWDHSHNGDEWVLVLKGEYESGGEIFKAGALHIEDEDSMHALKAGMNEECICLVMTQGPVKMKSLLGKVLAPIVGL